MSEKNIQFWRRKHPEIVFRSLDPLAVGQESEKILKEGFDIVVARGNSANELKKYLPNIYVINFHITIYDILRLIHEKNCWGRKIAIISVFMEIIGVELLTEIFGIQLFYRDKIPFNKIESTIQEAKYNGCTAIIGGTLTNIAGKIHGIPTYIVPIGPECMKVALDRVHEVREAMLFEETRQNYIRQLLDNLIEGVISIDAENNVSAINKAAEDILGISKNEIINKPVKNLPSIFHTPFQLTRFESLFTINRQEYVIIQSSIIENQKVHGGTFTLYEKSSIERLEHTVRSESYLHEHKARYSFGNIIGRSPELRKTIETAKQYAALDFNVLITGETGTGKELFAQSLHTASRRHREPFVAINCAAYPPDILSSELFGYVEGAFTGASRKGKPGLFEIAGEGTVFLDEIGEMDYNTQVKLLRVVQERYVMRLGSYKPIPVRCRIIAATNLDIPQMVRENRFREDLYYRLNVLSLEIPPLRMRKNDIPLLLLHYLNLNSASPRSGFTISKEARNILISYSWPGNIRELHNVAVRLLATQKSTLIESGALRQIIQPSSPLWRETSRKGTDFKLLKQQSQKEEIEKMLAACGGNCTMAAEKLGISRSTLWRRLKRC